MHLNKTIETNEHPGAARLNVQWFYLLAVTIAIAVTITATVFDVFFAHGFHLLSLYR